jgi:biotin operon repressor
MSATASGQADHPSLSEKQRRILSYLRDNADEQTYFKSRLIGDELGMSPKEVGTNMPALRDGNVDLDIEEWGYSSSTTWMVTTG